MQIDTLSLEGLECQAINSFNETTDQCLFARSRDDCFGEVSWIHYPLLFYCGTGAVSKVIPLLVSSVLLFLYFMGLGMTAEDFMCPSLDSMSKSLRLSENVAGVTLLAVGNGAPDIFSSIAGIRQSKPELVFGTLFGGGIFVATIVVGAILLTGNFKVMERPICRDIFFYAACCFVVWSIAYLGTIFLWEAITILVMYIVYIAVVVVGRIIYMRQNTRQNTIPSVVITGCSDPHPITQTQVQMANLSVERRESVHSVSKILKLVRTRRYSTSSFNSTAPLSLNEDEISHKPRKSDRLQELAYRLMPFRWKELKHESLLTIALTIVKAPIQVVLILTIPAIDADDTSESWSQILNCLHIVTGPLLIAVAAGATKVDIAGVPLLVVIALIGLVLALAVFFTSNPNSPPIYYPAFSFLAFVVSCCWIYELASEVVALLETLGFLMDVSQAILGLTVLAWGNSVGDLIANVAMARHGFQRMAISACFGGPLLNLLLGIGIPYCIMLPETESYSIKIEYTRMFTLLLTAIMVSLAVTVVVFMWTSFRAVRWHGFILIAIYLIYLVFSVLLEFNIM